MRFSMKKILFSVFLLVSMEQVCSFPLSVDVASLPQGSALATQVSQLSISQCKMVSVPASAGPFWALQMFGMAKDVAGGVTPVTNALGFVCINSLGVRSYITAFSVVLATNVGDVYTFHQVGSANIALLNAAIRKATKIQMKVNVVKNGNAYNATISFVDVAGNVVATESLSNLVNNGLAKGGIAVGAVINPSSAQISYYTVQITGAKQVLQGWANMSDSINICYVPSYYFPSQIASNVGQTLNAVFDMDTALKSGVFVVIQSPTGSPINLQTLNCYVYNIQGALLYSNTYALMQAYGDNDKPLAALNEIYYQVSPNFVFGGPVNTLFYIQSPIANLNGANECAPIAATASALSNTQSALATQMAVTGARQVIGVPLFNASMTEDISLVLGQSSSDATSVYTLQNISQMVTAQDLVDGVYVVLNNFPAYSASQNSVASYTLFNKKGAALTIPVNSAKSKPFATTVQYAAPTAASDMVSYIQKAKQNATPNQLVPAQATGGGMYIVGSCVGNPLLITTQAPYPAAFFLQHSTTGKVNPTVTPVAPVVPKGRATLITGIGNDVNTPLVGAAATIQNYSAIALANATSPVNPYASAAITASWNVIYDLYELLNDVAPTVAAQLPKSLQRPAA